ncbi:Glutamine synthetase 2 [Thalassocella blandensis]|nr:Glutamine synthetase 2 [Thalassocella blandensis]
MNYHAFVEYLWLDGELPSPGIRSKTRVVWLPQNPKIQDFPKWRFNGAFTGQSGKEETHCILKPVRFWPDPFRGEGHFIVLGEVTDSGCNAHETNRRSMLRVALGNLGNDIRPRLECEQPFSLSDGLETVSTFSADRMAEPHQCHYGLGVRQVAGREIVDAHATSCLAAGLHFNGYHAGSHPGEWVYQIGLRDEEDELFNPLDLADDLWLSRYLLMRVSEQYQVLTDFGSKLNGERSVNGSAHGKLKFKFSTAYTRDVRCGLTALQVINSALNQEGQHALVNIPAYVKEQGYGFIIDCRSDSNSDPYEKGLQLLKLIPQEE